MSSVAVAGARSRAAGAVLAQVWQAFGSFLLQILAARMLGASGLAMVSLCYGIIVLATALSSGMIGDSLTILDRRDPAIRGGLQAWAGVLVTVLGALTAAGLVTAQVLSLRGGALFFLAVSAFMVEDLLRRLLMAVMSFWKLLAVDTTALVATMAVVLTAYQRGEISLEAFLAGIVVGQLAGAIVAWLLLPADERVFAPPRGGKMRLIAAFGMWRGAQVSLPQAVQTVSRIVITTAAGAAALGHVEAARIYMAPALLTVQGLGSYLLAVYARKRSTPTGALRRIAVKASVGMMAFALSLGVLAVLLVPRLGGVVTGASFSVDAVIVMGWAVYAAASASLQPFASLAVVRGAQRRVFQVRLVDTVSALALLWVALGPLGWGVGVAPYVLAAGLVLGGILVRRLVLRPLSADPAEPSPLEAVSRQSSAAKRT